jgi:dipeptidyl aminopeptidase/acylaminoacyl peptidase
MTNLSILTPEDILSFKSVTDAQISLDGEFVAFVSGDQYVEGTKFPRSNVWITTSDGKESRQLTSGSRADTTPRWSPDGQTLAFLSDRIEDGQRQIYLLPRNGGEAIQLTKIKGAIPNPRGLSPMEWSPDGKKIAFLKSDTETEEEKERKRTRDDVIEFEKSPKYIRLHVVDVQTGEVSCVSPNGLQVWEFCWSTSGREFAAVASDLPFEQSWYGCRLVKFPVNEGKATTLHHDSRRQVAKPTWSLDEASIAFISSNWSDRGLVAGGVFIVSSDGGEARELSAGHVASATWLAWLDDSERLITAAHEQGSIGLAEIEVGSGKRTLLWRGEALFAESSWPQFSRDQAGNIAVVREDSENPRDIWLASQGPNELTWRQLTHLHPHNTRTPLESTETVHWKGADGWDMQGLLIRPSLSSEGGALPMVTVVHGGPTNAYTHQFYAGQGRLGWMQLLAVQGMAVFLPNPRGSTGWGLEFAESNIGDMGGKDWEDIQKGVDYLIQQGIADPDRLGITGWSYGGFMTAWAVTQTDRFKAAMMGAGISDWRSFHGRSYLCDWDAKHYGNADPWDPDGLFRRFSPITYVNRVKTPTLIIHGEEDGDVPVEQSYLFYRALNDLGVETELVIYPREPHGPQEKNHILDMGRRIPEWFARHLEST